MIKKGDETEVEIAELNSEGKGVSKTGDGFVIFTDKALPGDKALVKITKKKPNYAEARVIEIRESSPLRETPVCRYFGVCGGCKLQNYTYNKQIEFKTNVVRDALERIGGFRGLTIPQAIKCDEVFKYRNKMEFSFSDDEWMTDLNVGEPKNAFVLGLHVPKFHSKLINVEECFLQSELSNSILNFTREFFRSRGISVYSTKTQSGFLRFLIIRQSKNTADVMINIITYDYDEQLMKDYSANIIKAIPEITTIVNSVSRKLSQVAVGESEFILSGLGFISEKLLGDKSKSYEFRISPQSFFQTNTSQAEKLFNVLIQLSGFKADDRVLDLYCGTGSIAIFISGLVRKVLGVELSPAAIDDARMNSELNKIGNAEFVCSDIKEFLESEGVHDYNKVILDPPRSGLHPKICEILSRSDFQKIIYVSCNPHTQARDLKIICSDNRYQIEGIQPVDMFPHTFHVENIVCLSKSGEQ